MDNKALFKINCGLYITTCERGGKLNGCVTNTLMQQSHAPVKLSVTMQKSNFTHDMVVEKGSMGISVVSSKVAPALIQHFGYSSGRDVDKFADIPFDYQLDVNGNPLIGGEMIAATLSLKVYDTVDVGTHTIFLCTPDDMTDFSGTAVTYTEYQVNIKSKVAPKPEGAKSTMKKYVCSVCGYEYDPAKGDPENGVKPGTPWEQVPEDWVCPTCGVGKDMFEAE